MSLAVRDADVLGCWWAMCLSCAARIDGHGTIAGMTADGRVPVGLLFLNGEPPRGWKGLHSAGMKEKGTDWNGSTGICRFAAVSCGEDAKDKALDAGRQKDTGITRFPAMSADCMRPGVRFAAVSCEGDAKD